MLSLQTEKILAELLFCLATHEEGAQLLRQKLCSDVTLDTYNLFKLLDCDSKGFLYPEDLVTFMRTQSVLLSYEKAKQILFFFDSDNTQTLNYEKFVHLLVLPENKALLRLSLDRKLYDSPIRPKTVPYSVEFNFASVLGKEADLVDALNSVSALLKDQYDFDGYALFSAIDALGMNFITHESIDRFMTRCGFKLNSREVEHIFNRIDRGKDSKIDYFDFRSFISTFIPSKQNLSSNYGKAMNTLGTQLEKTTYSFNSSRMEHTNRMDQTGKSPYIPGENKFREEYEEICTNPRCREERRENTVRDRTESLFNSRRERSNYDSRGNNQSFGREENNYSQTRKQFQERNTVRNRLPSAEEADFLATLTQIGKYEQEIEQMKCELALRNDFTLGDAFRLFELDERGYVSDADFKYVFKEFGVYPQNEEISLIIRSFSRSRGNILNFSEFSSIFLPKDLSIGNKLKIRPTLCYIPPCRWITQLLPETKLLLVKFFKILIEVEGFVESKRQKWAEMTFFDAKNIFSLLDSRGNGKFTLEDLKEWLRESGFSVSAAQTELIFARFDRKEQGRVGYFDFCEEVRPQSQFCFI